MHAHSPSAHSRWAPEYLWPVAPSGLAVGDHLDRDGTAWIVPGVEPLDDGSVVVAVQRTSCNGLPGRFRLHLAVDTPLVGDGAAPGRSHIRSRGNARH